jgi:hypothetical protein
MWLICLFLCPITGMFGRLVDKIYRQISVYEDDMYRVRNDTGMECLPYPTFDDVIASNHILMKPVERFFNETQKVVRYGSSST